MLNLNEKGTEVQELLSRMQINDLKDLTDSERTLYSLKRSLSRIVSDPRRNTLPYRNSCPIN